MKKTEVYSWKIAFDVKRSLEEAARAERISLAQLLERIVLDWLAQRPNANKQEDVIQRRLHQEAAKSFGTIQGSDPHRSQEVSLRIKSKLRKRLASQRTD